MSKSNLQKFLKASNEIILVIFQFLIIILHFIKLEFLPKIEIIKSNFIFSFLGYIIIIIASIILLLAIKDLGSNLSPFPRPITNGKLITSGIYGFIPVSYTHLTLPTNREV